VPDAVVKRSISLPTDVVARVDEARGDIPFSRWLLRAVELRLDGHAPADSIGVRAVTDQVGRARSSAEARAGVVARPKRGK
jgi:hypothetical protein